MDDCGSAAGIRLAGLFSIGKILTLYEINIVLCSRILMQGNSIRRSVCNLRDTKTVGRFSVLPGLGNRYETSQNSLLPFLFRGRCNVTRSVSKMTEIERRGGKRWDKPKKAGKSRDCGGGKF